MAVVGAQPGLTQLEPYYLINLPHFYSVVSQNPSLAIQGVPNFNSHPYIPSPQRAASILERRSFFYADKINPVQAHIDQVDAYLQKEMTKTSNLFMLGGASYVLQSAKFLTKADQILDASAALFGNAVRYKKAALVLPALLAGCEAGTGGNFDFRTKRDAGYSNSDAGSEDGGENGVDQDGDGVPSGLDCDDSNPNMFPLQGDPREVMIKQSTTICPGTYYGFTLFVTGSHDVNLQGDGVILDGRADPSGVTYNPAIRIENSSGVQVSGFNLQYYQERAVPNLPGILRVTNSKDVQLTDMVVTADKGNWPIRIVGSQGVLLEGMNTYTHSDRGVKFESCQDSTIKDCNFYSEAPYDYFLPEALVYISGGSNNVLVGSQMKSGQGSGLWVRDSDSFQALTNQVIGNMVYGLRIGHSNKGYYKDNQIHDNAMAGIYIEDSAKMNTFTNNNVNGNKGGAYGFGPGGVQADNTYQGNNPQP